MCVHCTCLLLTQSGLRCIFTLMEAAGSRGRSPQSWFPQIRCSQPLCDNQPRLGRRPEFSRGPDARHPEAESWVASQSAPARLAIAPRSDAALWRLNKRGGNPLPPSGPRTGWIAEWTITSAPCANFPTCSEVDDERGGSVLSLPASPPITTLPVGVSTR